MPAIEVRDLRKRYGKLNAVDGASFSVATGEIFGLLGPNGAGKTTTLEIVEGLRQADSGSVEVLGEAPWPRNPGLIARIGVQLQSSAFFQHLTAREQIRLFAALYGASTEQADRALTIVGLDAKDATQVERLSGGQRQRLSIACALAHDPELVFLDEPTGVLDPQSRRNLWEVIRAIREDGRTVVLTTHYMDEAEELCDRVAIIDAGKLLALDTPDALIRNLDAPSRVGFAAGGAGIDAEALAGLPGASELTEAQGMYWLTTRDPAATLAALAGRGALHGLQVRGATLEDVFLELTGREYRQ